MLTFHIIYIKNSVYRFRYYLLSLLEHTDYNYRLVSNGCNLEENKILISLANSDDRISYWCSPASKVIDHGHILNMLQEMCKDEFFCFMDSDIFATSQIPDVLPILNKYKYKALFSCLPIWVKDDECTFRKKFKHLNGTYNQLEDGQCIGNTYWSIYHNDTLKEILQFYKIGFEPINSIKVSPYLKKQISIIGYTPISFDTGKLINLILVLKGIHIQNIELKSLIHIGGVSVVIKKSKRYKVFERIIRASLKLILP